MRNDGAWRMAACVLAIAGGCLALGLGFLIALVSAVMGALDAATDASAALIGLLVMVLGFGAFAGGALLFRPAPVRGMAVLAVVNGTLVWAFSRIDAANLAIVPVVPLFLAMILGLAGIPKDAAREPVDG